MIILTKQQEHKLVGLKVKILQKNKLRRNKKIKKADKAELSAK
jgi:hypothetical protein